MTDVNLPEETPKEPEFVLANTFSGRLLTAMAFATASSAVAMTGVFSGIILKKTTIMTFKNVAHTVLTKGRVWLPSKYRDFRS